MQINQEIAAFHHELGEAIAQWGYVEGQLLQIVLGCMPFQQQQALAVSYHSVENFRSKLSMCNSLVCNVFKNSPHLARWHRVREKTASMSTKRNRIAHGWHKLYVNNTPGRRWAIVPLHGANGELIHADGEKPPDGSICLRELAAIHCDFHALTTQLCNVYELFRCGRAPFSDAEETPAATPTLRALRDQLLANASPGA